MTMAKPSQNGQVLWLELGWRSIAGLECARGPEEVSVECTMQPCEQRFKGLRISGPEQLQQRGKAILRRTTEYGFTNDLAVLQVGDKHGLH